METTEQNNISKERLLHTQHMIRKFSDGYLVSNENKEGVIMLSLIDSKKQNMGPLLPATIKLSVYEAENLASALMHVAMGNRGYFKKVMEDGKNDK